MAIIESKEQSYKQEIANGKAVLYFGASWCSPCKMLTPAFEEISNEIEGLKIIKIDVDENQNLAGELGIMSVPTMQLYINGELVNQRSGYAPKEALVEWINEH